VSTAVEENNVQRIGPFEVSSPLARCLVSLLDALGWRGDHGHLAEALPCDPDEMDLVEFLNTMANLNFEGHGIDIRLDRFDDRLLPGLFVGDEGGVKVLVKSGGDEILAYDGTTARYTQIPRRREEGTIFIFKMVESENLSLLQSQPYWFARVLARFRKLFVNSLVLSLILSLLALLSPLFIMSIYGHMTVAGSVSSYVFWGVGITIFIIANAGFRLLRSYLMGFISVRLGNIVGNQVLRRLLYLPPSFTETASLGAQVARIKDFETVRDFFAGPAATALLDMPFILLLMVGMVVIGGNVAYVPLAAILLFVLFSLGIGQIVKRVNVQSARAGSQKQEFILETLTNLRAVKYAGNRQRWLERYRTLSADAAMNSYNSAKINAVINAVSHILVSLAGIATVGVGATNVMAGRMSMGALMACVFLVWRILAPLRTGFVVITQIDRIRKSIVQLNRFMAIPLENKPETAMTLSRSVAGRISFSQVAMRYSSDAFPALIGVSFEIEQGESLAIVGHDGAGKSTVLKLILGMYVPQAGRILVDDMNVRQMDLIMLRRAIAYAPEANHLFHATIAENLRLANPAAADEELHQAAGKAGLLPAIQALPDQFETNIDASTSSQFTSDFAKRLTLARVFLKKSSLWLLDEPGKGLSSGTWLIEELEKLKGLTTVVMVTQSQELIDLADKMLWLDRGRVRMFGPSRSVKEKYLEDITQ